MATASSHDRPVYLTGPSGAGKLHAAVAIHRASARADRPFVVIDCRGGGCSVDGVGDDTDLHPDASLSQIVGAARGGTVVFRSLSELDARRQGELLDILDTIASRGRRTRIIATDSRNLSLAIHLGALRADLQRHFAADEARIPSLRDRAGEIPGLVAEIAGELPPDPNGRPPSLTARAMHLLQSFSWPGEVRQLRDVVAFARAVATDGCVTGDDVEQALRGRSDDAWIGPVPGVTFAEAERAVILAALRGCGGSITQTAVRLGLSRRTVQYRLREFAGLAGRRQVRNLRR